LIGTVTKRWVLGANVSVAGGRANFFPNGFRRRNDFHRLRDVANWIVNEQTHHEQQHGGGRKHSTKRNKYLLDRKQTTKRTVNPQSLNSR